MSPVYAEHAVVINENIAVIRHPEHCVSLYGGAAGKGLEGGLEKGAQGIQSKTVHLHITFGDNVGYDSQGFQIHCHRGTVDGTGKSKSP